MGCYEDHPPHLLEDIRGSRRGRGKRRPPGGRRTPGPDTAALDRILAAPVLRRDLLKAPVKIDTLELLRDGTKFLVRVRSSDGAESVTVPNNSRLVDVYPLFLKQVAPFFIGKDARDLEPLLWEVYRHQSNYKFQGLAFWVSRGHGGDGAAGSHGTDLGQSDWRPAGRGAPQGHRRVSRQRQSGQHARARKLITSSVSWPKPAPRPSSFASAADEQQRRFAPGPQRGVDSAGAEDVRRWHDALRRLEQLRTTRRMRSASADNVGTQIRHVRGALRVR